MSASCRVIVNNIPHIVVDGVIITQCKVILPFWGMNNIISLNQFNHLRVYWAQTNIIITAQLLKDTFANQ